MRVGLVLFAAALFMLQQIDASEKTKRKNSKAAIKRATFATYTNRRFGFQVSYPKRWKISRSHNGDGFHAVYKNQELRAAASFLGVADEQEKSLPLKRLINYWEPELKIRKTAEYTLTDSYKSKNREALIGYYREKSNNIIKLITRDEDIQYTVWATNIPEATTLKLLKTFKITKGEEKY